MSARARSTALVTVVAVATAVVFVTCGTLTDIGATVGEATGTIDRRQAASIRRTGERMERSFEDFTPEQEYYIGRSVAATVLDQYPAYENDEVNEYLDTIGQIVVLASDRPSLFADYSFQVLDDDEVNAFATPGGHIFLTRGMVRLAENEDELAAVLAHEVAHVVESHGLQTIRTSRITAALTSAAITGAQFAAGEEVAELTEIFEGTIDDVTQTLFTAGYSRSAEREADQGAVKILRRAGYAPSALASFLERMDARWEPDGPGLARTHPSPSDRLNDVRAVLRDDDPEVDPRRSERFRRIMENV